MEKRPDSLDPRLTEGVFRRGWSDLQVCVGSVWFYIPAALLTAGFAAYGATLPTDATPWERIVFAVAGSLGGALILGSLVFALLVAMAPVRQRDDARALVVPDMDPAALAERFSTWLIAKRAAMPAWPLADRVDISFKREIQDRRRADQANAIQQYRLAEDAAKRQARAEYHEGFRSSVLSLVNAEEASDPRTIEDFGAIEELLRSVVRGEEPT